MNVAALLSLQDIDSALDANANKRPRLPELAAQQLAAAEVGRLRSALAAAQQRIDGAQAAIDAAEHSAAGLTAKRTRLEAQLKTVIAPREAEALMSEIATLVEQRNELDDQELAALDEQASAEMVLHELAGQLPAAEAILAAADAALAEMTAALDDEVASLGEQRAAAAAALDEAALVRYTRTRHQFGGVAVARLQGSHCSGCHMDLSPAELDGVRAVPSDDLAECPQCGRFLAR